MGEQASEKAIDRHVGVRVRAFRVQRGWTQGELAARLGISQQQIHKYETGVNRIAAGMLYRLSQVMVVDIAAFFVGVGGCSPSFSPSPRPSPIKGEGGKGDHRVANAPRDDSGVVIANAVKQSLRDTADPNPSTRALKIAMALEAIPNPGLRNAITELIAFSAGLIPPYLNSAK